MTVAEQIAEMVETRAREREGEDLAFAGEPAMETFRREVDTLLAAIGFVQGFAQRGAEAEREGMEGLADQFQASQRDAAAIAAIARKRVESGFAQALGLLDLAARERPMQGPDRTPKEYHAVAEVKGYQVGAASARDDEKASIVIVMFDVPEDAAPGRQVVLTLSTAQEVADLQEALQGCADECGMPRPRVVDGFDLPDDHPLNAERPT